MPVPLPAEPATRRRAGFAPVVDAHTRLLILGSLPGDASLAAGQYYAHPRNGFWRLTGGVIGRDLVDLAYPQRLAALQAAGIGLWDVITTAHRTGSLDTAIRDPEFARLGRSGRGPRSLERGAPRCRALSPARDASKSRADSSCL